jgi:hypothetical protein
VNLPEFKVQLVNAGKEISPQFQVGNAITLLSTVNQSSIESNIRQTSIQQTVLSLSLSLSTVKSVRGFQRTIQV